MSVGYRIEFFDGEKKRAFGVATDIGYVTEDIKEGLYGCEAVVIESNHDVEMLKSGPYPRFLKERILSHRGHLSNPDSALFASQLASHGTKSFLLAHLSAENNTPSLALDEFVSAVADPTVRVSVADAERPTELYL